MMCLAVIAIIQAKDRKALLVQKPARAQHICGIDTALPAMQEHHQPFCHSCRLRRIKPLQPNISDGVEGHFSGTCQHEIMPPAWDAAGEQGLGKGASQVEGRGESCGHEDCRRLILLDKDDY